MSEKNQTQRFQKVRVHYPKGIHFMVEGKEMVVIEHDAKDQIVIAEPAKGGERIGYSLSEMEGLTVSGQR